MQVQWNIFYKFSKNPTKKRTSVTQARKIRISHARGVLIPNVKDYFIYLVRI